MWLGNLNLLLPSNSLLYPCSHSYIMRYSESSSLGEDDHRKPGDCDIVWTRICDDARARRAFTLETRLERLLVSVMAIRKGQAYS